MVRIGKCRTISPHYPHGHEIIINEERKYKIANWIINARIPYCLESISSATLRDMTLCRPFLAYGRKCCASDETPGMVGLLVCAKFFVAVSDHL